MIVALARFLSFQFNARRMIQIASIALIGVDVNLQLGIRILTDQQIFKGHRALGTLDLEGYELAVFDAVVSAIAGVDMHMPSRPDHSFMQLDGAGWTDQNATWGPLDVSAVSDRSVDPQGDRIGESQLDLASLASRSQYPNVGIMRRRGPTIMTVSAAAKNPSWYKSFSGVNFFPLPKSFSTCSSVR